jgi:hydrogenase expression/formation protein HypE
MITLAHGAGGREMDALVSSLGISARGNWQECDNDASALDIGSQYLVFTTDSFVVDPIFFPGGNIGDLAFCGTVNDLAVMGAKPLGLSLALVIEEGFRRSDLAKIMESVNSLSQATGIPLVTGDTKVMDRGKLDRIVINTSGIGTVKKGMLLTKKAEPGDKVIISGGIGEHAVALLSTRFNFSTGLKSDTKPLIEELRAVSGMVKCAKDATRGGIAAVLNEIADRNNVSIVLDEKSIPVRREVRAACDMLGIDPYTLAGEGVFLCIAKDADAVVGELKKFNPGAAAIGKVQAGQRVVVKTGYGKRVLPRPTGRIVPRIC